MTSPRVTVLLTVYNGNPLVSETIDAVLNQTYDDFELVIVDDGSKDDTRATVETYDDPRIRTIFLEHVGRGAALNSGLIAANGEFVAIVDADDIPYPDRLENQVKYFEKNPEVDVLGSWYDRWWPESEYTEQEYPAIPSENQLTAFSETNPLSHSTSMYRRSAAAHVGGYNEKLSTCIDYDFWVRLGIEGFYFDIIEESTCKIRKHEDQSFRVGGFERLLHYWNSYVVRKAAISHGNENSFDQIRNFLRFGKEVFDWIRTQKRRQ